MCWCKECKQYDDEVKYCLNPKSDNYMEMPGEYNSCEHSETRRDVTTEEYGKGFADGYREAMDSK